MTYTLDSKINNHWGKLSKKEQFIYLTLAINKQCSFYFAAYLKKIYKELKNPR